MSDNKQSSVDWYIIERHNIEIQSRLGEISPIEYDEKLKKIEEQAKEMHKKEHGQTWDDAMENMKSRGGNDMRAWADFDDYYEEKFGGIDEQRQGKN